MKTFLKFWLLALQTIAYTILGVVMGLFAGLVATSVAPMGSVLWYVVGILVLSVEVALLTWGESSLGLSS